MHQKLTQLLRQFSRQELTRFHKLVQSPYFNENERLLLLLEFLLAFEPDFDHPDLGAERAFATLFPDETFDKKVVNRLSSQLYKLAEAFAAQQLFEQDAFQRNLYLLQYFDRKMLDKHFESVFRKANSELQESPYREPDFFRRQLELERAYAEFQNKHDRRDGDIHLQAVNNSLDVYFLLHKLMLLGQMKARQSFVNVAYDFTWLEETLTYLAESQYAAIPTIALYRQVLLLQLEPKERAHYFKLKALLEAHQDVLPAVDQRVFYAYLQNAAKHIFPVAEYYEALFELYRKQIEAGILYHNEHLFHSVFRNVVNTALSVGELDWAAAFIEANQERIIPADFQEFTYWQNLAMLHFYRQDFEQAQACLLKSNPSDIYYKLADKSLLARIYYELRETEALENFLNTFRKFIFDQQKKIATAKIQSYRTYVNYLSALLRRVSATPPIFDAYAQKQKVTVKSAARKLTQLRRDMEAEGMFYGKKWLLEKIDELI